MAATGAKKLAVFWGFQYAMLIGEAYSSLYPHGYEHLTLDGVVHGKKAYRFGDVKPSSVRDAEKNSGVFSTAAQKPGQKAVHSTPKLPISCEHHTTLSNRN